MLKKLEEKLGLKMIPAVFFTSAILAIVFVAFAAPLNEPVAAFFDEVTGWISTYFGWFYILSVTGLLGFLIWVAMSRYGTIRLGGDDARPEYSTVTWFTMLFAAGIGTILMFWGVAEPMTRLASPPLEGVDPGSREAARLAMSISLYHFGLHTWTIFTLPALAIGYFAYRHELPMRISSIFYPVLGEKIYGPWGWTIDVIALLGTLFGVAVSVSLGTLQLNSGLNYLVGLPTNQLSEFGIIVVITVLATISVALGLDRGIRRLSQFNIAIAVALMLFIWLVGPTLFITKGAVESVGNYIQDLPWMAFWTETFQDSDWQRGATVFYWAWTIAWAPYVGIFIARISRGRTIRQFVAGALGAPTLFTVLWFSSFGLAAINLELDRGVDLAQQVQEDVPVALFSFLEQYPWALLTSLASVIIIAVFLTTSADSAALVVDLLSRRDDQPSQIRQRVFWTLMLGGVAATLLLGGGLEALQNVIITLGLPFCALLVFMAFSLLRALHADHLGYSLKDLAEGRTPKMEPMGDRPIGKDSGSEPFMEDRRDQEK
ncbi:choline/glycine/proline betaine transport protein [Natronospira proteinivora]|uniref:Choline/glycine/proline betaine transport protein n=1 Tax=Natronospira proteinivora TaxID=1807133 RepID=A0ABT1G9Y6_9GAMM|nr:BCCT family transporter [Natronospira proteinivora]MCP1728141.1 choline/glycine/proline betaine transport protein [Natronospira proteinivora]